MSCRCGYQFCWLCGKQYGPGHFSNGTCEQYGGQARGVQTSFFLLFAEARRARSSAIQTSLLALVILYTWRTGPRLPSMASLRQAAEWLPLTTIHRTLLALYVIAMSSLFALSISLRHGNLIRRSVARSHIQSLECSLLFQRVFWLVFLPLIALYSL